MQLAGAREGNKDLIFHMSGSWASMVGCHFGSLAQGCGHCFNCWSSFLGKLNRTYLFLTLLGARHLRKSFPSHWMTWQIMEQKLQGPQALKNTHFAKKLGKMTHRWCQNSTSKIQLWWVGGLVFYSHHTKYSKCPLSNNRIQTTQRNRKIRPIHRVKKEFDRNLPWGLPDNGFIHQGC